MLHVCTESARRRGSELLGTCVVYALCVSQEAAQRRAYAALMRGLGGIGMPCCTLCRVAGRGLPCFAMVHVPSHRIDMSALAHLLAEPAGDRSESGAWTPEKAWADRTIHVFPLKKKKNHVRNPAWTRAPVLVELTPPRRWRLCALTNLEEGKPLA